ncbi:MAG TPA: MotA/TolQ/ExbB proton channel family protein [Burkholderiaceae bacterium]|nr:MotA/TolQ/ExbB proton channel family protein [Burkholderiaceae bacterium]
MLSIVQSLGWPVWPLIIASVVALALIIERGVALRASRITPAKLLDDVLGLHARGAVNGEVLGKLERSSPLGRILAAGLRNAEAGREAALQAVVAAGNQATHELSRYMTLLGSIGSIAPLLGLFGTVIGMIEIFAAQQIGSSPQQLAHGISVALYSTAFGIIVAVPSTLAYRQYRSRIDDLIVEMEDQAQRMIETLFAPKRAAREATT